MSEAAADRNFSKSCSDLSQDLLWAAGRHATMLALKSSTYSVHAIFCMYRNDYAMFVCCMQSIVF